MSFRAFGAVAAAVCLWAAAHAPQGVRAERRAPAQPAQAQRPAALDSRIVDTGQAACYDDRGEQGCPAVGEPFYGQDAQHAGAAFDYAVSDDGLTVRDNQTALTWTRHMLRDSADASPARFTFDEALAFAQQLNAEGYGGFRDWRVPSIKELYSLIDFNGHSRLRRPYLGPEVFEFHYGGGAGDEPTPGRRPPRAIDAQFWSSTCYAGLTFGDNPSAFGVNFADGRIKAYPAGPGADGVPRPAEMFLRCVRGRAYGANRFVNLGDGTILDEASGLMWTRDDSGSAMNWREALEYAERCDAGGHSDWRLPNAKELQSIVDYSRAPEAADAKCRGPAIDPLLRVSDPLGDPWYWTSTTHLEGHLPGEPDGTFAVYVCFGRATGRPHGRLLDVHGAGAQRSDPKRPPTGGQRTLGPQADELRGLNYVRCVRTAVAPAREQAGDSP